MHIGIINGPNMNILGQREQSIYGSVAFEDFLKNLRDDFPEISLHYQQHNEEGKLVNALHEMAQTCDALLLNPAAYTHSSIALGDAVKALAIPVLEIHLSQVQARESFRHHSYVAAGARGTISGLGLLGYRLGIEAVVTGL